MDSLDSVLCTDPLHAVYRSPTHCAGEEIQGILWIPWIPCCVQIPYTLCTDPLHIVRGRKSKESYGFLGVPPLYSRNNTGQTAVTGVGQGRGEILGMIGGGCTPSRIPCISSPARVVSKPGRKSKESCGGRESKESCGGRKSKDRPPVTLPQSTTMHTKVEEWQRRREAPPSHQAIFLDRFGILVESNFSPCDSPGACRNSGRVKPFPMEVANAWISSPARGTLRKMGADPRIPQISARKFRIPQHSLGQPG